MYPYGYNHPMNTLLTTEQFDTWLRKLKDATAKFRIIARIRMAGLGNFGDCAPVGEGVSEMRIHVGAGYRVYFIQEGERIYLILGGGDKSTQKRDIAAVKDLARHRREE